MTPEVALAEPTIASPSESNPSEEHGNQHDHQVPRATAPCEVTDVHVEGDKAEISAASVCPTEETRRAQPPTASTPTLESGSLVRQLRESDDCVHTRSTRHVSQANPPRERVDVGTIKARSQSECKPPPLQPAGSIVLIRYPTHDATSDDAKRQDTVSSEGDGGSEGSVQPPPAGVVTVELSIRYGRLALTATLLVGGIIAFATFFVGGLKLTRFDEKSMSSDGQIALVNWYNARTANIATMLTKPVEPFVTLAVQIVVVRVLRKFMLRTHIGSQFDVLTLFLTTGAVFLINNSFNALNVQLHQGKINATISAVDLLYSPDDAGALIAARTTNFTQSISSMKPQNPITNTVLRNLVLPRRAKEAPKCDWKHTQDANTSPAPDTVLEYGFAQRDWQSRLLEASMEPKTLRLDVAATENTSRTPIVDATRLPMSASTAADLYVSSVYILEKMFPGLLMANSSQATSPFVSSSGTVEPLKSESFAEVMRLLPPNHRQADDSEETRRSLLDAVMHQTQDILHVANKTRPNATIEFSHVDVLPSVTFDAVTIEFEVDPFQLGVVRSADNTTLFKQIDRYPNCLPELPLCMVPKTLFATNSSAYDVPPQVQVFAACTNSDGTEQLRMLSNRTYWEQDCKQTSDSSIMVISIGKRLLAESLDERHGANSSGLFLRPESAVVTNLRKVYTFTVGKLSWVTSNLSHAFNASCGHDAGSCMGLRFHLSNASTNSPQQELIIGEEALPVKMNLFFPLGFEDTPRYLPLVRVLEPLRDTSGKTSKDKLYTATAGDILLPHNIRRYTWEKTETLAKNPQACNAYVEDRLKMVLNNHMYIEHGLQTAYTAATFFLLQNGVVRDVIKLDNQTSSLAFQNNKRDLIVFVSVPRQSAWYTIVGCSLLFAAVSSVIIWSYATTSKGNRGIDWTALGSVSAAHVVARVMLDSEHFPDLFLDRRVRLPDDEYSTRHPVDRFLIDALALRESQQAISKCVDQETKP